MSTVSGCWISSHAATRTVLPHPNPKRTGDHIVHRERGGNYNKGSSALGHFYFCEKWLMLSVGRLANELINVSLLTSTS